MPTVSNFDLAFKHTVSENCRSKLQLVKVSTYVWKSGFVKFGHILAFLLELWPFKLIKLYVCGSLVLQSGHILPIPNWKFNVS